MPSLPSRSCCQGKTERTSGRAIGARPDTGTAAYRRRWNTLTTIVSEPTSRMLALSSKVNWMMDMGFSSFFVGLHWPDVNRIPCRWKSAAGKAAPAPRSGAPLHKP